MEIIAIRTDGPVADRHGLETHPLYLPDLWQTLCPGSELYDLLLVEHGRVHAAALGILQPRSRLRFWKKNLLTIPFAPSVEQNRRQYAEEFFLRLLEFSSRVTVDCVNISWKYGKYDAFDGCCRFTDRISREIQFFIDLGLDETALIGSYQAGKSRLNKAAKDGLSYEFGRSFEDLMDLYRLQRASNSRLASRGSHWSLPEKGYYRKVYRACLVPGHSSIIFAVKGGRRVSGLMFLEKDGRALVQRGGTIQEGFKVNASRYLHHMLLKHLKDKGCREVFFGGVPLEAREANHPEHGLYLFKRGFPATERTGFDAQIGVG